MPLHIGLAYNLKIDSPASDRAVDWAAECEDSSTVDLIASALTRLGHHVTLLPFNTDLISELTTSRPDIVLNIAEGWSGRNRESLVPAILEFLSIPYTGSDPLTLGLCLDKAVCKSVVGAAGVPVPPSWVVKNAKEAESVIFPLPAFVKPNTEGSSKGVRGNSRVETRDELLERVQWVTDVYRQPALVEPYLMGREFTIGILDCGEPRTLPILEVISAQDNQAQNFVYSYETKTCNREKMICPAPLSELEEWRLREIALIAYKALDCHDVSRVDIRMDEAGHPYFLEINPLPGLSACSLLPMQAAAAGISYDSLIAAIVNNACRRYNLLPVPASMA